LYFKYSGCSKQTVSSDCGPMEDCIDGKCTPIPCTLPVNKLFFEFLIKIIIREPKFVT